MRILSVVLLILLAPAATARAQQAAMPPIGRFVVDLRGFYSGLKQDPVTASQLAVPATDLPARGLGVTVGAHIYVFHRGHFAFGGGAEAVTARGRAQATDADTGKPVGLPIVQHLRGFSPQISLNFGHRSGWSYLSAGSGPLSFSTYQGTGAPTDPPPSQRTINMGGGARWFNVAHVAFCFDMRFYLTRPADQTAQYPGRQRTRLLVMSAGVAFK
jgi:hypothetical protein